MNENKEPKTFTINDQVYTVGDQVSAVVEWPNGRRTNTQGTLITVDGDEAYIESPLGPVAVNVETLEPT